MYVTSPLHGNLEIYQITRELHAKQIDENLLFPPANLYSIFNVHVCKNRPIIFTGSHRPGCLFNYNH